MASQQLFHVLIDFKSEKEISNQSFLYNVLGETKSYFYNGKSQFALKITLEDTI